MRSAIAAAPMSEHPILSLFLAEAESGRATTRSLAVLYALIIAGGEHVHAGDWRRVNDAANAALRLDTYRKIDRFRAQAWAIHDATAERQQLVLGASAANAHEAPRAVQ